MASPHPFHKDQVIQALEAGKHVLCEKPMGINALQVKEMIDAASSNKRYLMEAMWTRFLPVTVSGSEMAERWNYWRDYPSSG